MALSEIEIKRVEKAAEAFLTKRRPPAHIRSRLDFGWRLEKQSIYLFEIRPVWNNPTQVQYSDFAKATFVRSQGVWNIHWMRQNLKWNRYDPIPQVRTAEQFFEVVNNDEYSCFFG